MYDGAEATGQDFARELHYSSLVIDSLAPRITNDLLLTDTMRKRAMEMLRSGRSQREVRLRLGDLLVEEMEADPEVRRRFIDIWKTAGVTAASTTHLGAVAPSLAFEEALHCVSVTERLIELLSPEIRKALRADDIEAAAAAGQHAVIMNLQEAAAFGDDLDRIDLFYNLGIRSVQLTYNRRNLLGDGCTELSDGGLSHFGIEVLKALNERRILVDLSHCGPKTTWDGIRHSSAPVAFTHTFSKSVCMHDRGKTDDQIRAVAEMGGYIGVLIVPGFIQEQKEGTLEDFVRHVDHIVEIAGIDHVGVGTDHGVCYDPIEVPAGSSDFAAGAEPKRSKLDWIGWRPEHRTGRGYRIIGYERWTDWPNITAALLSHGYSPEDVRKIIGKNFLRVFREVVG